MIGVTILRKMQGFRKMHMGITGYETSKSQEHRFTIAA